MRKLLLATAALVWTLENAHAQMVVVDPTAIAHDAIEAAKELASLQTQYRQLVTTYQALAHATNINGMAQGLSALGIQSPFNGLTPQSGIIQGTTLNGLGAAQPQAQTLYNGQQVQPGMSSKQSAGFMGQWINQRSMSLAATQALALQLLSTAQSRSAILPQLQAQLQAAPDVTTITAVNGRIALEQHYLQSAQAQAEELTALQASQTKIGENQILQKQHNDAQQAVNDNPVDLGGF